MKFLLDTNVWLDALLLRPRSPEILPFPKHFPSADLAITDVSICSIGIYIAHKSPSQYRTFLEGLASLSTPILEIARLDWGQIIDRVEQFGLDFDDAYQYFAAEVNDLQLISFDVDFDSTPRGRKTPAQVMP